MQKEKGLADMPKREESAQFPDYTKPLREAVAKFSPKNGRVKWISLLVFAVLAIFLFKFILDSNLSAMGKAISAILLFLISGELMRGWMNWDGFYGLIMFKDRSTLGWIERQANKYAGLWIVLSDISMVMGYGLFSMLLIDRKRMGNKYFALLYATSIPLLFLFSYFVAPLALPAILGMITGGEVQTASTYMRENISFVKSVPVLVGGKTLDVPIVGLALAFLLLLFGLAGSVCISLVAFAVLILPAIVSKIGLTIYSLITGAKINTGVAPPPGGSPILPGVNLPLVEGILALASILMVHEMSHGFLATIAKIRLDSAGLVFFGVLPFGAFVEPDEKEMEKIDPDDVNRIMVAGSGANIIASIVCLFLLTSIIYLTYDLRLEGWKVNSDTRAEHDKNISMIPKGALVYSMGGMNYTAANFTLPANSTVIIGTDMGNFTRATNASGKVGITMAHVDKFGSGFAYKFKPGFEWMEFVLNTLGLMFAINVLVGIMNLMPIPLFDGYKLMCNGVKNKMLELAVGAIATGAFFATLLPWIFK